MVLGWNQDLWDGAAVQYWIPQVPPDVLLQILKQGRIYLAYQTNGLESDCRQGDRLVLLAV
jgi:hypothetical protein